MFHDVGYGLRVLRVALKLLLYLGHLLLVSVLHRIDIVGFSLQLLLHISLMYLQLLEGLFQCLELLPVGVILRLVIRHQLILSSQIVP